MNFDDLFIKDEHADGTDDVDELFFCNLNQEELDQYKEQKDAVIFLIDCSLSMFKHPNQHNDDATSSMSQVLKACLSFMKSKIITSDVDKIGIVLFNTRDHNNALNFPNLKTPDWN